MKRNLKLSCNYSAALVQLVKDEAARIDAIEWVWVNDLDTIAETREALPDMPFTYHPGRAQFNPAYIEELNNYLSLCDSAPWLSFNLSPLPNFNLISAIRHNLYVPSPPAKMAINRFIKGILKIKSHFQLPVILKNMPVLFPGAFRYETDPGVIREILEETDSKFLLDLPHAAMAAEDRNISVRDYLRSLPMDKVVQIHVTGVRRDLQTGRSLDSHHSLQEEDYSLLNWCLSNSHPEWITLEYFNESAEIISSQLERLNNFLR